MTYVEAVQVDDLVGGYVVVDGLFLVNILVDVLAVVVVLASRLHFDLVRVELGELERRAALKEREREKITDSVR